MRATRRVPIGAAVVLGIAALVPFAVAVGGDYRLMRVPSETMTPAFHAGDWFVPRRGPAPLARGDVVLVNDGEGIAYILRIAGLAGDRIAVRGGIVILNGRPLGQRLIGEDPVAMPAYGTSARRLVEQFPGEAGPHEIYDEGVSPGDEFPEQAVAPGHVFLLGDNRDYSADSRLTRGQMGVGQVAQRDLRGAPLVFIVSAGHRLGDNASH